MYTSCIGFWKRFIRTNKEALKRCLGCSSLCYNELLAAIAELEATVNCRPLKYLEDDVTYAESLTPSRCLVGKHPVTLSTQRKILALSATTCDLRRRARYREQLLRHLSKR
ncbi:hypothetical protein MRX96_042106 [Rhipicephalus microplus]